MDKETIELVNYIRTLIPPGVSQKQAITSFAVLLADAVYQIDKEKCDKQHPFTRSADGET